MELLAPAGSKESFVAALRAGADAFYAGVPGHNARAYAKSMGAYDLEVLTDHAHEQGRKVYLAFNTLIKQGELKSALSALESVAKFSPDAVIVQDMGIARLVREYFPDLDLHASTQLAAHNSQGVAMLAEQGFKRAILARELSFSELKLIAARSRIGLETFCHGALCFCVSGMCLFSSALGGHSGNRGRCTQPCRRLWGSGREKEYVFSPRDLQLAEQVPKLRSLGLSALKIEGRMRSSDYVYRVVKAYRMLIDAPADRTEEALREARTLLEADYARTKTTALFLGRDPELIRPGEAQCLGRKIGEVVGTSKDRLSIEVSRPLAAGDRLRIADPRRDKSAVLKVREFKQDAERCILPYDGEAFQRGASVFLAGDARSMAGFSRNTQSMEKSFEKDVTAVFDAHGSRYKSDRHGRRHACAPSTHYAALLQNQWIRTQPGPQRLWIRVDDPGWLRLLPLDHGAAEPVFSLHGENLHSFLNAAAHPPASIQGALCELPPYIGQREVPEFQRAIKSLMAAGFSRWILNNVSHFRLFDEKPQELIAGHFLYTWNAFAALAWKELGVSRFVMSWEEDVLNLTELCRLALRGRLVVYLYGHPPLARSRLLSRDTRTDELLEEKPGMRLRRVSEAGSELVIPEFPVSLFNARHKLASRGIETFGVDLSFIRPDRRRWEALYAGFRDGTNAPGTLKLNFKRGVK